MQYSQETTERLDVVAKVLLRCFLLGYLLLLVWFACVLFAPNMIYGIGNLFDLKPHEVDLVNYCGMAFVKCCAVLFFFIPFISIRLVLRKRSG